MSDGPLTDDTNPNVVLPSIINSLFSNNYTISEIVNDEALRRKLRVFLLLTGKFEASELINKAMMEQNINKIQDFFNNKTNAIRDFKIDNLLDFINELITQIDTDQTIESSQKQNIKNTTYNRYDVILSEVLHSQILAISTEDIGILMFRYKLGVYFIDTHLQTLLYHHEKANSSLNAQQIDFQVFAFITMAPSTYDMNNPKVDNHLAEINAQIINYEIPTNESVLTYSQLVNIFVDENKAVSHLISKFVHMLSIGLIRYEKQKEVVAAIFATLEYLVGNRALYLFGVFNRSIQDDVLPAFTRNGNEKIWSYFQFLS